MKVPDLAQATGKTEKSQKPKNVDLGKVRKKNKHSKHLVQLIIILVVITLIAVVWINADTIFEPLRGIASKIETKTTLSVGYPIELTGSGNNSIMRFGSNFSLLNDTYLYTYDSSGAQLYALKHGYSHPQQATSEKRIMLFDKAGTNFSVYSKSSLIYQNSVEDKIVYSSIGNDGLAAIVTESKRYSNVLYIYDDGGNWKYTKKFADENVMSVCSVGDGNHIVVATLSASHGDIITNFYKFSIFSTENHIWKCTLRSGSLPCGMFADNDNVIAVCDNSVISIDSRSGELNNSYAYSGQLRHFYINGDIALLQYNDISANRNVLTVFNNKAEATAQTIVSAAASCVYSDADGIYVLDGARLKVFDTGLINENVIHVTDDDYTDFVKIGNDVIMLGYETVNSVSVADAESKE